MQESSPIREWKPIQRYVSRIIWLENVKSFPRRWSSRPVADMPSSCGRHKRKLNPRRELSRSPSRARRGLRFSRLPCGRNARQKQNFPSVIAEELRLKGSDQVYKRIAVSSHRNAGVSDLCPSDEDRRSWSFEPDEDELLAHPHVLESADEILWRFGVSATVETIPNNQTVWKHREISMNPKVIPPRKSAIWTYVNAYFRCLNRYGR